MRESRYRYREKKEKTIEQKMNMRVDLSRVPEVKKDLDRIRIIFDKYSKTTLINSARAVYNYQRNNIFIFGKDGSDRSFEIWANSFDSRPYFLHFYSPPEIVSSAIQKGVRNHSNRIKEINIEIDFLVKKGVTNSWLWSLMTGKTHSQRINVLKMELDVKLSEQKELEENVIPAIIVLREFYDQVSKYSSTIRELEKFLSLAQEKRSAIEEFERKNGNALAKAASLDNETRKRAAKIKVAISIPDRCPYCNKALSKENAHLDHVYPVSKGGLSILENLVYCCSECNSKKSDKGLFQFTKEAGLDYGEIVSRLNRYGKHV